MVLLMVVVLVSADALAVLMLRPEVSAGDENTGMHESCAEGAKGRDEGAS
jgi:hypothetical protein